MRHIKTTKPVTNSQAVPIATSTIYDGRDTPQHHNRELPATQIARLRPALTASMSRIAGMVRAGRLDDAVRVMLRIAAPQALRLQELLSQEASATTAEPIPAPEPTLRAPRYRAARRRKAYGKKPGFGSPSRQGRAWDIDR